jgi:hypothetical protein
MRGIAPWGLGRSDAISPDHRQRPFDFAICCKPISFGASLS